MKVTRSALKSLIKEEMNRINEAPLSGAAAQAAKQTAVMSAEDSDESGDGAADAHPPDQERAETVELDKMQGSDLAAAVKLMIAGSITKAAIPQDLGKPWGGLGKSNFAGGNHWSRALKWIAIANVRGPGDRTAKLVVTFVVKPSPDGVMLSIAKIETSGDSRIGSPEKLQNMADELMNSVNAANLHAKSANGTVSTAEDNHFILTYNLS
jgi:hypothetical protein